MHPQTSPGVALVSGASAGIGAVYAERLARRGYDLVLVARDVPKLEQLAARLRQTAGRTVEVLPADLGTTDGIARVVARLADAPAIGLLVNSAGIALAGTASDADPDRLDAMMQLNVVAATRLATAASAGFRARGGGTLINIASVLGLAPERFNAVYAASKAFIIALSQGLAAELAGTGVRVQAVLPGATRTSLWEKSGLPVEKLRPEMVMDADEMVDAAHAGLELGELVTIPSLPDAAAWARADAARLALGPDLSLRHAAPRYRIARAEAAA